VIAAMKAQKKITALNNLRKKNNLNTLPVRIGINTGPAISGCMGTRERAEYTIIGHTVNVASRFQEAAQPGQIIMGEVTAQAVKDIVNLEICPPQKFRGLSEPIVTYRLTQEVIQNCPYLG